MASTTTPVRGTIEGWLDEFRSHNSLLRDRYQLGIDTKALFLGDSITKRWYQPAFQCAFGDLNGLHLGISGDRIQNLLWRVENYWWQYCQPKCVVLLIGTNNLAENTPAEIKAGINAIIGKLKASINGVRILLLGLLPRALHPYETRRLQAAQARGVYSVLGFTIPRVRYREVCEWFTNNDDTLTTELYKDDFLHLTPDGYYTFAEAISYEVHQWAT